jgi:hypothetical protein
MKNVGPEIDKVLHQELLESFIKFIEYFSPVLTKETLSCLVPHFIKFAQLESKLEKFYK